MSTTGRRRVTRREALATGLVMGATAALPSGSLTAALRRKPELRAGEATIDTTPPLGIELAGFHRTAGNERRITAIRQPSAVRALVLELGGTQIAIVSVDIIAVSAAMASRVQSTIEKELGIPASQVRVCATHTHSMPTFQYFRQWGAIPAEYQATVERAIVAAVRDAQSDASPAALSVGESRTEGANFNRTTSTWKTDREFDASATDAERWLDTRLQVLRFERTGGKRDLLWYHFSAHPVCYTDTQAGPDWPGLVDHLVREKHQVTPSFLQGHIGDVNPGDGQPWIGDPQKTSTRVFAAFDTALSSSVRISPSDLRIATANVALPLDLERHDAWRAEYAKAPERCTGGTWVDAGFARDWAAGAGNWDRSQTTLACPISAVRLGDVALVFHPAELYSYYGLAIRHASPAPHTLAVGYCDGFVGYLTDPKAYRAGEYAAIVVPKILDVPPFKTSAAHELQERMVETLRKIT